MQTNVYRVAMPASLSIPFQVLCHHFFLADSLSTILIWQQIELCLNTPVYKISLLENVSEYTQERPQPRTATFPRH